MAATAAVDEAALAAVRGLMRAARVPGHFDKVYKEECMFCFASNESPGGLFINLSTHQAFDAEHLPLDQQRGGPALYLHQQARKVSQRRLTPSGSWRGMKPVQAVGT
ncbi:Ubiquitin carboxyl-terminal hydrolase 13 [Chlorella vulgaris]